MSNSNNSSSGCGCFSLLFFIFAMTAWIWGLPTPWGTFSFDIFPPAIHMNGK